MPKKSILGFCLLLLVVFPASVRAGDAFVKFGLLLNELEESFDFGDRWQLAAGSDWKVADLVGIGFEVQFAYRKYEVEFGAPPVTATYRAIPLNVFGNLKLKPGVDGPVHPYGGVGMGLMGSFNSVDVDGLDLGDVDDDFDGGFHAMGGVELGSRDSAAFLIEFELARSFKDGAGNAYFLYGGVRF